jgi:hypothetical protein
MQPTIHSERKAGYGRGKYPALRSKCIVGCIFNSVGLIITCESLVYYMDLNRCPKYTSVSFLFTFNSAFRRSLIQLSLYLV